MTQPRSTRRSFLATTAVGGIAASLAGALGPGARVHAADSGTGPAVPPATPPAAEPNRDIEETRPRPAGQKPVHELTTTPLAKVRVAIIGLSRGMTHVDNCAKLPFVQVVAVCDMRDDRAKDAADHCEKAGVKRPEIYSGNDSIWEKMVDRDDIDVVYLATPWAWHVPMALRCMQRGKHAFVEVAAAVNVDDCWKLVDTSEATQRHCVMLENCCYGETELFVLNMARAGVFGELMHAECGYLHDLRSVLFSLGSEGDWRRNYHEYMNGNLYPTHGLGPVAQYLGIGRGDQFSYLVSMSSPERDLTLYRDENRPNGGRHAAEHYVCGDMNTSLIKTKLGRSIMIQHDVVNPRPYSRINALSGTKATFFDYPPRLAINHPGDYQLQAEGPHEWLGGGDMDTMRARFTHPLWKALEQQAKGGGHGGMDYVMSYRHLDCIRKGLTPDSVVYDAAAWSSLIEISSRSVADGSRPVTIPDFTRGLWHDIAPLGIATST